MKNTEQCLAKSTYYTIVNHYYFPQHSKAGMSSFNILSFYISKHLTYKGKSFSCLETKCWVKTSLLKTTLTIPCFYLDEFLFRLSKSSSTISFCETPIRPFHYPESPPLNASHPLPTTLYCSCTPQPCWYIKSVCLCWWNVVSKNQSCVVPTAESPSPSMMAGHKVSAWPNS